MSETPESESIREPRESPPGAATPPAEKKSETVSAAAKKIDTEGVTFNPLGDSGAYAQQLYDAIEMIGEETAAGYVPAKQHEVTAGMRYLHSSRTIHQLVTDRNRAVGIYLAVASLSMTAAGAILHANPSGVDMMVPVAAIQRWCLPVTFGALTVLALLMALVMIRTRAGLIYEVAKMNALVGLPVQRVQTFNPLSIFFLMQTIISLAGGLAAALFTVFMIHLAKPQPTWVALPAIAVGATFSAALLVLYVVVVHRITTDAKLKNLTASK